MTTRIITVVSAAAILVSAVFAVLAVLSAPGQGGATDVEGPWLRVPSVVGLPVEDAEAVARSAGFGELIVTRVPSSMPQDVVLSQSLTPISVVTNDKKLRVDVADYTVFMPDVVGLELDEALQALADAGIDEGDVDVRRSPVPAPSPGVIAQDPAPRTHNPARPVLSVEVPLEMPDLSGLSVEEATTRLANIGVDTVTTNWTHSEDAKSDKVAATSPAAGEALGTSALLEVVGPWRPVPADYLKILDSSSCNRDNYLIVTGDEGPGVRCYESDQGYMAWNTNGSFQRLRATFGYADYTQTGHPLVWKVFVDGVEAWASSPLSPGLTETPTIDIAGASAVRISATTSSLPEDLRNSSNAVVVNLEFLTDPDTAAAILGS